MKWLRLLVVGVLIGVGAFIFIKLTHHVPQSCAVRYRRDTTITVGSVEIATEEAKTSAETTKGLGGRACIDANEGMLFPFAMPGYYPFWMKDMKFPIDMIWINPDHKVVTIKPDVAPSTYPNTFVSSSPAKYVLELKAGQAKIDGIKQGTTLNF